MDVGWLRGEARRVSQACPSSCRAFLERALWAVASIDPPAGLESVLLRGGVDRPAVCFSQVLLEQKQDEMLDLVNATCNNVW